MSPTTPNDTAAHNRQIALWLLVCCAMIYGMVILGGVTRLTHSGLSIVQWQPISGVIPPLDTAQWQREFDNYKKYPEYRDVNRGMTLSGFKSIFWLEYFHRLLGRLIGVVFLVPFLYFLIRGRITRALVPKLVTMFVLGGLQGLLGWLMVESGLHHQPHVSPYRLTAHLGAAVLIYAYILWVALGLLSPEGGHDARATRGLRRFAAAVVGLVFVMMLSGGFVAGTRAGFVFNTFPLMYGHFLPPGMFAMQPLYRNFFENLSTVQFDHRMIAYLLCIVIPAFWLRARRHALSRRARIAIHALLAMLAIQVSLGIGTLLLVVPVPLAAAHQAGALLLLTIALYVNRALRASAEPVAATRPGAAVARAPSRVAAD